MSTGTLLLEADGVTRRFGAVQALDGVSLRVEANQCLALVGESGSGKTTLLRCFNRLVDPDQGRIRLEGRDISGLDPVRLRRHTGYVPQNGGLLPHWQVRRNVELVPRLLGMPDATRRADEALALVGLTPDTFAARWPRQLSGGERQRVALARALAAEPTLLLLDEPFGALDAITRSGLQQAFQDLRRRLPLATVLVTHDLREAFLLADRIAVLRRGVLEQAAEPAALRREPATDYVRALLDHAGIEEGQP